MATPTPLLRARFLLLLAVLLLGTLDPLALASPSGLSRLTNHRGPILHGNVNLGLIWYGPFGRVHKNVVRSFIKSHNIHSRGAYLEPQVSSWWKVVESFQSGTRVPPPIHLQVVRQVTDRSFSVGKVVTEDFIPPLVQKATGGNPNILAVIFANRDVTVQGLCTGECYVHGLIGRQPYIIVGDPQNECPGSCAWPFHRSHYGRKGVTLQPPNGNVGGDSMVINLAYALAATVTNPYATDYFLGPQMRPTEATLACPKMFGSRVFPGYTGKVRVNSANEGGFNVRGSKGRKFLLPAIWNPRTACVDYTVKFCKLERGYKESYNYKIEIAFKKPIQCLNGAIMLGTVGCNREISYPIGKWGLNRRRVRFDDDEYLVPTTPTFVVSLPLLPLPCER